MPTHTTDRRLPLTSAALCAVALLFAGCASTSAPVVYAAASGDRAKTSARIAKDSDDCRRLATAAVGLNGRSAPQLARDSAKTAAVGFAAAAVGAAVASSRDVWQRARTAAAAGAAGVATKILLEWNEPDEVHEEYVERCMKQRGHDVLGWR